MKATIFPVLLWLPCYLWSLWEPQGCTSAGT